MSLCDYGAESSKHSETEHEGVNTLKDSLLTQIVNGIRSRTRLFYVRLRLPAPKGFCGGTIIGNKWILTSTNCLDIFLPEEILVEIGDFAEPFSYKVYSNVTAIWAAPFFRSTPQPANDIALVKTQRYLPDGFKLPLCSQQQTHRSSFLGTVGMGATVTRGKFMNSLPNSLREMAVRQSGFPTAWNPFAVEHCPEYNVCTEPVVSGANICLFDFGGPLFKYKCGTTQPQCLFGVASYASDHPGTPDERCNAGSTFTSVPHFAEWIRATMASG
ncbi:chymotrypsin-2-like [Convolutriloba macropyga]|uniref:chymotrypsin-2-like n=1 Tax=Convolutriloba macropyga TaxID=536237 RepID=UPI003F524A5E